MRHRGLGFYPNIISRRKEKQARKRVRKREGVCMTDKELQKLKRGELLELLLEQSKENESLKKQIEELQENTKSLQEKLADRKIELEKAGSIAEAALQLNGVYAAAEASAKQYLDNLELLYLREKENCEEKEAKTKDHCAVIQQAAEERCAAMKEETEAACSMMKEETEAECSRLRSSAKEACDSLLEETRRICEEREQDSLEKCRQMEEKAEASVERRWETLSVRLEEFYQAHVGLRELLTSSGQIQRE